MSHFFIFFIMLVLARVAASHSCVPAAALDFAAASCFCSSLDYFNNLTVRFLGEFTINSN
jgi:hypothetical protein